MRRTRPHNHYLVITAATLGCCRFAHGTPPHAAPADNLMTITTVTGRTIRGEIMDFDLRDYLVVEDAEDGDRLTMPAANVVSLAHPRQERARFPRSIILELAGGDRLVGVVTGAADEIIALDNPSWTAPLRVALTSIAALVTPLADQPRWQNRVESFLSHGTEQSDRVLLANGDTLCGLVAAIDQTGIAIEIDGTVRRLRYTTVVVASLLADAPAGLTGRHARVSLDDGTEIVVSGMTWHAETGLCVDFVGDHLCLTPERVTRIEILGGRWRWLTTLTPVSVEHTAMMSLDWEHRLNRSVMDTPLRVAHETFAHGIGAHSRSSLIYELKGQFREFVTRFGLDQTAGPLASVDVVIRVDGRTSYRQRLSDRSVLHGPIRIPVTGARTLELLVDFADNGAIQDRFDWIEPGLVR